MRRIQRGLLALTFLCFASAVRAQDPTEAPVEEPPDRWGVEVGLSLNSAGGNESLTVFTTTLGVTHLQTDLFEMGLNTRLRYGESEGEKVAQNLRGDLNFDLWPQARWSPFVFGTAEQDPFRALEVRLNAGAGVKHTFWQDGWNDLSVSAAALYSYEDLAVPDTLGTGITQTIRWSFRARARRELGTGSRLEQVVFFQPALDRIKDYQIESISNARIALSERLAFTATFLYQRDNTPAPEVEPDDYSLSVGLSVSTQW